MKNPRIRTIILAVVLLMAAALITARAYLPIWVKDYVNQKIDALEGYSGSVEDIDINLWRGAYQIHGVKILKDGSGIPVPFVDIKTADLSVEWGALLDGAIVAEIDFYDANLNFAIGRDEDNVQTGEGAGWSGLVDALSPLDINRLEVHGGELSFKDFSADPPADVFIKDIELQIKNLRNVEDKNLPLPSPVWVRGKSIGGGDLEASGDFNILKNIPDFDLDIKLEKANLPAINNLSRSVAGVDFESGSLSIYIEAAAKDGAVLGYIKPIASDVNMVSLEQDSNPFNLLWESVVSVFAEIFKNHGQDQIATRIELEGSFNNPETDSWSAFVGFLRNTIEAFKRDTDDLINFSQTQDK